MQRALTPKRQVAEILSFVRQLGVTPKHSEVLELTARLNGAANWNELQNKNESPKDPEPQVVAEPAAGIRDVDVLTTEAVFIGTTMFDEEQPWSLMRSCGMYAFEPVRELTTEEVNLLLREGVAMEASVAYPRCDRYGLPDVAVASGFLEWLHAEQGISSCHPSRFELFSEDTGDDSPATCVVTMRLPKRFSIR